jgi:hypothetical protein
VKPRESKNTHTGIRIAALTAALAGFASLAAYVRKHWPDWQQHESNHRDAR